MSLNFDFTAVKDYDTRDDIGMIPDGDGTYMLAPITEHLVWMTISVGLGRITEANADEFFARASIIEHVHNMPLRIGGEKVWVTPKDVQDHVGLVTNVADETRTQWARRIFVGNKQFDVSVTSDLTRTYRHHISNQEAAA